MASRLWSALALILVPLIPAIAADGTASTTATPVDPKIIQLHLMDGSMIAGKLSVDEIEVETRFGKLKIPIESIRSFTPGLQSHPELGKQVYGLIEKLGSSDYDQREMAQKELSRMGEPVRPELLKHRDDTDKERRERVRAILDELDEAGDDAEVEPRPQWFIPHDLVETSEFTAVGKIVTTEFTIATNYGPLNVKLSDVRRGERPSQKAENLEKTVTIDGAHLVQRGMKETGVRIDRGDKVTISAEGTLNMTPWGNGSVSSPNGASNFGWLVQGSIPGGMLIATIGNNTQYLKVGSQATIKATRSGTLRLGIAMQQDYANQQFPGGYQAKIVVERQ
jgi:hypothetical protein